MPAHSTSTKMVIHAYGFLPSQLMSVWKVVFSRPNWELKDHTPDQCTGGDGDQTWDVEDRLEQTSALESLLAERHGEQQRHDDGQAAR